MTALSAVVEAVVFTLWCVANLVFSWVGVVTKHRLARRKKKKRRKSKKKDNDSENSHSSSDHDSVKSRERRRGEGLGDKKRSFVVDGPDEGSMVLDGKRASSVAASRLSLRAHGPQPWTSQLQQQQQQQQQQRQLQQQQVVMDANRNNRLHYGTSPATPAGRGGGGARRGSSSMLSLASTPDVPVAQEFSVSSTTSSSRANSAQAVAAVAAVGTGGSGDKRSSAVSVEPIQEGAVEGVGTRRRSLLKPASSTVEKRASFSASLLQSPSDQPRDSLKQMQRQSIEAHSRRRRSSTSSPRRTRQRKMSLTLPGAIPHPLSEESGSDGDEDRRAPTDGKLAETRKAHRLAMRHTSSTTDGGTTTVSLEDYAQSSCKWQGVSGGVGTGANVDAPDSASLREAMEELSRTLKQQANVQHTADRQRKRRKSSVSVNVVQAMASPSASATLKRALKTAENGGVDKYQQERVQRQSSLTLPSLSRNASLNKLDKTSPRSASASPRSSSRALSDAEQPQRGRIERRSQECQSQQDDGGDAGSPQTATPRRAERKRSIVVTGAGGARRKFSGATSPNATAAAAAATAAATGVAAAANGSAPRRSMADSSYYRGHSAMTPRTLTHRSRLSDRSRPGQRRGKKRRHHYQPTRDPAHMYVPLRWYGVCNEHVVSVLGVIGRWMYETPISDGFYPLVLCASISQLVRCVDPYGAFDFYSAQLVTLLALVSVTLLGAAGIFYFYKVERLLKATAMIRAHKGSVCAWVTVFISMLSLFAVPAALSVIFDRRLLWNVATMFLAASSVAMACVIISHSINVWRLLDVRQRVSYGPTLMKSVAPVVAILLFVLVYHVSVLSTIIRHGDTEETLSEELPNDTYDIAVFHRIGFALHLLACSLFVFSARARSRHAHVKTPRIFNFGGASSQAATPSQQPSRGVDDHRAVIAPSVRAAVDAARKQKKPNSNSNVINGGDVVNGENGKN